MTKYQCRDSCQNQSHFPCPVVAGVTGDLQVFLILTGIIRGPSHNEGTCRHQLSVPIMNLWTKTSFQLQVSWSIGLFAVRRWWHIVAEVGPGVNLLAIWSESYMNEGLGSNDSLSIHTKVTLRWPRRSCFLIVQFFLIVFYWGHPFKCRPLGGHLKAEVWGPMSLNWESCLDWTQVQLIPSCFLIDPSEVTSTQGQDPWTILIGGWHQPAEHVNTLNKTRVACVFCKHSN